MSLLLVTRYGAVFGCNTPTICQVRGQTPLASAPSHRDIPNPFAKICRHAPMPCMSTPPMLMDVLHTSGHPSSSSDCCCSQRPASDAYVLVAAAIMPLLRLLGGHDLIQSVVVGRHTSVVLVLEADNDGVPDAALQGCIATVDRSVTANRSRKRKIEQRQQDDFDTVGGGTHLVDGNDLADLVEPVGLRAKDLHLQVSRVAYQILHGKKHLEVR